MYIHVTQYDNMQRAFVGDSPQLRVMSYINNELLYSLY